ncbi:Hypothetical predicted protein [Octopus vulgaris]|uniref:Uncharacterized protein n=1 Tax=Octopus vulgaris TaxID=6645 RepID=A0AA36F1E3_OCTVU|nr:Hypothetical predicted protein [Octopus vulgaris]
MTEQNEVKRLMEEYKWYEVGETRYAVIEKKNIDEFMVRCERENWEAKDIRMSDEFVENMDEYFGVRMDMEFIRIGKEHSSDGENQRTVMATPRVSIKLDPHITDWLKKTLGLDDFKFEYNERSLFILRSLMNINYIKDKTSELRVSDLNQKALEYKSENRSLSRVLNFMELEVGNNSKCSKKYLEILCELARLLNLNSLSETSYMMALINLKNEMQVVSEQKFKLKPSIDNHSTSNIISSSISPPDPTGLFILRLNTKTLQGFVP